MTTVGVVKRVQMANTSEMTFEWDPQVISSRSNTWKSPSFWLTDPLGVEHEFQLEFYDSRLDYGGHPQYSSLAGVGVKYVERPVGLSPIFTITFLVHTADVRDLTVTSCQRFGPEQGINQASAQNLYRTPPFGINLYNLPHPPYSIKIACTIIAKTAPCYEDKELRLHKNILSCRSTVFAAMFDHNLRENNTNRVSIEDQTYGVMLEFFRYLYSAKVTIDEDNVIDLLVTSNKYDVKGLKSLCEQSLMKTLDNEKALELLNLANLYNAKNLEAECLKFIVVNAREIVDLPTFDINKVPVEVRNELFKAAIKKN